MKIVYLITTLLLTTIPLVGSDFLPEDWARGTHGYEAAYKEAMSNGTPMLVYFYASWCPYSAKLNRQLSHPDVRRYLKPIPKVAINGGARYRNNALAKLMQKYRVSGFPTIFVIYTSGKRKDLEGYQDTFSTKFIKVMRYGIGTANMEKAARLYKRAKRKGTHFKPWELKKPVADSVKSASDEIKKLNEAAFKEIKAAQYKKGLEILWKGVKLDATNGDGWYGLGHCYYRLAERQKGENRLSLLKDAKRYYSSAVKFKVAHRKELLDELYEVSRLLKQLTQNKKSE